jgi:hypothetical protein
METQQQSDMVYHVSEVYVNWIRYFNFLIVLTMGIVPFIQRKFPH